MRLLEGISDLAGIFLENAELFRDAAEANRAKDEFLATLSHELRNPLGAIANAVAALERRGGAEEAATRLRQIIHRQTHHLTRLVDDLLDVARATAGKIPLNRQALDLSEVVGGCVRVAAGEWSGPPAPRVVPGRVGGGERRSDAPGPDRHQHARQRGQVHAQRRDRRRRRPATRAGRRPARDRYRHRYRAPHALARVRAVRPGRAADGPAGGRPRHRSHAQPPAGRAARRDHHRLQRRPRARLPVHGAPARGGDGHAHACAGRPGLGAEPGDPDRRGQRRRPRVAAPAAGIARPSGARGRATASAVSRWRSTTSPTWC